VIKQERRRTFERRPCRGEVLIYNLSGGPALKAALIDLGRGGASIALDRHLSPGMVVRLVFPRKSGETHRSGRVIVGNIVHSRIEAGRHVIGVVFGWHAAVKDGPQPLYRKTAQKWFGLFSRKSKVASLGLSRKH
jgi:PilZ domain